MMELVFYVLFMTPLVAMGFYVIVFYLLCFTVLLLGKYWFMGVLTCVSYGFGVDLLSLNLIILGFWVLTMMFMASQSLFDNNFYSEWFSSVLIFMLFFLSLTFMTGNLIMFYIFFESSLIPTLLLIFGWGYQPERLAAGFYLLFYTLFASLPLLIGIIYIYSFYFTCFIFLIDLEVNFYLFMVLVMAFLIKMPMIFVHFWLPKAHVEAPISGSMILAALLLKLGGYGLLRVMVFLDSYCMIVSEYILGLSLYGMFIVGLVCLSQVDMKSLIAYSSVSHMGIVLCGIFTVNYTGVCGSLILMIGHGLCSSGLFCLANIVYERTGSRSLFINKGLMSLMPSLTLFWFLICVSNMASPPSFNLVGEVFLINGVVAWSYLSSIYLMVASFLGCAYSVYLYSAVQHGSFYSLFLSFSSGNFREYMLLFCHWFPLNILILKSEVFSCLV